MPRIEEENGVTVIYVPTPRCVHCGEYGEVPIPFQEFEANYGSYLNGRYIQEAFPDLSAEMREQMISGTHPACWDEIFAGCRSEEID
jgi:hypothetical protein